MAADADGSAAGNYVFDGRIFSGCDLCGVVGAAAGALQISSVSMFWSCLLGSSQSAFWMTYVSLIAMAAGPPLLVSVFGLRHIS